MKNLSDYNLWLALKKGDMKAFSTLFEMFYPLLYNYGLKISNYNTQLTEDCLQDFFLYIYEHRENLADLDSIRPYMFVSFRRSLLRDMKKGSKMIDFENKQQLLTDFNFSSEELMIHQEIESFKNENLVSSLNKLPNRQKEVLYLKYYSNLSIDDIAKVLDINYQSVLNLVYKGIKKLREDLSLKDLLKNI